jgi:hypothetical protein
MAKTISKNAEQAVEELAKEWAGHVELPVPHDSWLAGLAARAGLEEALCAIQRTGRKARYEKKSGTPMDGERARSYCQAVAHNAPTGNFPDRGQRRIP